ncbi:hypothetical protein SCHPADRAFT_905547 [Schizopora paradoxa]|uniref:SURP motif domain-containing protein n=1 Tax=Schizopora paradoxa TaxID=27342 RepID=A0A0H2RJE3_9AGAM|nr:hypothetical protein SCHPADRAFT_905547 [Schizopora paradoxa]
MESSLVDPGSTRSPPPSPSGWSDLPSDSEDTFFFSASETSELRQNKRRRLLDAAQSARLKSLREREGETVEDSEEVGKEVWGDDDEVPDETQAELMRRAARHIVTSPDPVLLEMRILANHGSDGRFAFLRGRWKHNWQRLKALEKAAAEREKELSSKPPLGLDLGDYGDSDDEDSVVNSGSETKPTAEEKVPSPPVMDPEADIKAARRLRAKEWSLRRKMDTSRVDKEDEKVGETGS